MRFQLRYEYLVEMNAGQLRVPIQVTPSIPALTRKLKIYINDTKPISCIKPEKGTGYDNLAFNMISKNEAELLTELSPAQTREFVLIYRVKGDSKSPGTTLIDKNGYMFLSYTLPTSDCHAFLDNEETCKVETVSENGEPAGIVSPKKPFKLCLLFIVDISGSMKGDKINQTKLSLLSIVEKLSDDDCIGIILFSRNVTRKTIGLVKVGASREKLNTIINNIRATGSTNFDRALQEGINMMIDFSNSFNVDCVHLMIALTDGRPTTGLTASTNIIQQFKSKTNEFAKVTGKTLYPYFLGFGSNYDLNFELLQKLAADNLGFSHRIYRGSDVKHQLVDFFKKIACPVLCSMQLKFHRPNLVKNVTKTNFTGCFFYGSQLFVAAHIKNTTRLKHNSQVALEGSSSEGQKLLNSNQFIINYGSNFIERTWAYMQITQALEQMKQLSGEDREQLENKILLLSLQYKFVTHLTSLVVVKPCDYRALGILESVDDDGHTTNIPDQNVVFPHFLKVSSNIHYFVYLVCYIQYNCMTT